MSSGLGWNARVGGLRAGRLEREKFLWVWDMEGGSTPEPPQKQRLLRAQHSPERMLLLQGTWVIQPINDHWRLTKDYAWKGPASGLRDPHIAGRWTPGLWQRVPRQGAGSLELVGHS